MSQRDSNPVIAITGHRDVSAFDYTVIEWTIIEETSDLHPSEFRFGGADGADTMALDAAWLNQPDGATDAPLLNVVVPFTAREMPDEAADCAAESANCVYELGLERKRGAYLERNRVLLDGIDRDGMTLPPADRLVAFYDGRDYGGTLYTIREALRRRIPVRIVPIGEDFWYGRKNPAVAAQEALAPIHAIHHYMNRHERFPQVDVHYSRLIRALKDYRANRHQIAELSDLCIDYLEEHFPDVKRLIPMPRRHPYKKSDLVPLAREISKHINVEPLEDWLVRISEPQNGFTVGGRLKYPLEEHAASFRIKGDPELAEGALLFDNVLTTSGTMVGAQQAVMRDTGIEVPGFAVLYGRRADIL